MQLEKGVEKDITVRKGIDMFLLKNDLFSRVADLNDIHIIDRQRINRKMYQLSRTMI